MPARRGHLAGSVYKDGNGYRAQVPYRVNGALRYRKKRFPTREEAETWCDARAEEHKAQAVLGVQTKPDETLADFARTWLDRRWSKLSPRGQSYYKGTLRRWIIPRLGHLKFDELTSRDIELWLDWVRETPSAHGTPLAIETIHDHWRVLNTVLNAATKRGLMIVNPARAVEPPQHRDPDNARARRLAKDEISKLTAYLGDHCEHEDGKCVRWTLSIYTAMRQSEVLGLERSALFLDDARPHIVVSQHAIQLPWRHGCGAGVTDGEKTEFPCGRRSAAYCPKRHGGGMGLATGTKSRPYAKKLVPLSPTLVAMMRTHLETLPTDEKYVFPGPHGIRRPEYDRRDWHELCKTAGVAPCQIQDLRITSVSETATLGVGLARQLAGHTSVKTTEQSYIRDALEDMSDVTAFIESRLQAALT